MIETIPSEVRSIRQFVADDGDPVEQSIVVTTRGLSKSYKDVTALKSLDLEIHKNSIVAFLGPNGAGKSTTIKLLLGLARPTTGSATVFGLDVVRDSIEIRKRVGYLAQDPRYYDHMTARQTLRFRARFFYAGPKVDIDARVADMLELVGLTDKEDRPIKGFSGGERQRLGIAQAYINAPDLLILDEPAASLDPMGRRDVLEVMQRLRKDTTILYSTHILEDAQKVSDSVAIMNHGELVAQAPVGELISGKGTTVYSLAIKGDPNGAHARVSSQAWVSSIDVTPDSGYTTWQVSVTDEEAAEAQLLGLVLSDGHSAVTEFGRKKYNLEEVFMSLVEGGNDG